MVDGMAEGLICIGFACLAAGGALMVYGSRRQVREREVAEVARRSRQHREARACGRCGMPGGSVSSGPVLLFDLQPHRFGHFLDHGQDPLTVEPVMLSLDNQA